MVACAACGRENPAGFAFCGFCAAPLSEAHAGEPLTERKVVTVLFCDLVGFTAASESADPEDVHARLSRYHARLRSEIEGFGGTVEKFIGDAVMALFGAPVAHEDDPERAIRAGLSILDGIVEMNEAEPGLDLSVRIGINTGEALVALAARPQAGEGMATGDVVNTASRLQGIAPVGGIAVGELTYRATERVFSFEELEPAAVKGKADPIRVWRPLAPLSRFGTDLLRAPTTPFVGRDVERNLLIGQFERSVRDATVQFVTILGEPGVGKSRLVGELFAHVEERTDIITWRQGRCLPYGEGITFWALGEIVKAHAGILETDGADEASEKLGRVLPPGDDGEWFRQCLRPLIGLEAPHGIEQAELFTAWRRFLEYLAERRPLVVIVEDLHWAEDAMLAFVEHVLEWAEGVPMLLVGTARPELYERLPTFAATARNATRINLAPLSERETAELVGVLLGDASLPAEVQAAVLDRAGGNPFYAEEFVRLLRDRDVLVPADGGWELAAGAEFPMPDTLLALVASRLDTLAPERKALLADAAVIGKVFWAGAIAEMGETELEAVTEALHELSRKELVRRARVSSVGGEAEYAFWHALVRDVAYARIPRSARAEKHRRAAAWIERRAAERVEDVAEILAHHYVSAIELAQALGHTEDLDALRTAAARSLAIAGERALGLDTPSALASLRRARKLLGEDDPDRPRVLGLLAMATTQAGELAGAVPLWEETIEGYRALGDAVGAARATMRLANLLHTTGDPRRRKLVEEARLLLESEEPGPVLVEFLSDLAGIRVVDDDLPGGIEAADRALVIAEELGLPVPTKALGYRGTARCGLGDRGGFEDTERAISLAVEQGLAREAAVIYYNRAIDLQYQDGPAAGLAGYRAGLDFSRRRGIVEMELGCRVEALGALIASGALKDALGETRALAPELEARGNVTGYQSARLAEAEISLYESDLTTAAGALAEIEESVREGRDWEVMLVWFSLSGAVAVETDDSDGAAAALRELADTPLATSTVLLSVELPRIARTAEASGALDVLERLLADFEPLMTHGRLGRASAVASLEQARGNLDGAAAAFADVAPRWEAFGVVPEHAYALFGHARCALALGRAEDGVAALRRSRAVFESMGATLRVRQLDALIERTPSADSPGP